MKSSLLSAVFVASAPLLCFVAPAQQGAVSFKHFRTYPTGEWKQEIQAYRNGNPTGPVQTSMSCSSPLSPVQAAAATKLGNDAAPMCSIKVVKDEELTAEYEQVCDFGPQKQIIHSTMHSIDDRTNQMEIRHTISGTEMSLARITTRYQGPCTAGLVPATIPLIPAMPKPPAEQCAAIPEMKKQAAEAVQGCSSSDTPEADRPACIAAMKQMAERVHQMESQCK